eukprot:gene10303-11366_t
MQRQNINRHMKTAHSKTLQYSAICCEQVTGLYMVRKSQRGGINYPCHVQKIINADGSNKMECGVVICREEMLIAARSDMQARECAHLLKANNAYFPKNVDPTDDQLQQLSSDGKHKLYQVGKIKNPGDQQTEDIAALDDPEVDISFENITDNSFAIYPPDSQTALLRMIEYMQNTKKLPYTEHQKYVKISPDMVPTAFIPSEITCHQCYEPLSPPRSITYQAKVLTLSGIKENIEAYFHMCNNCNNFYRYEDYSNDIHNYNDIFLIGLDVCQYMRECLKNRVAVATVCKILSGILQVNLDQATVVNAYAHFEALSERNYEFNCIECGIHPVILIADVNRKVAFKCPSGIQNLKDGAKNFPDSVDANLFWDKIERNMICFGFRGRNLEASDVEPSLSCWAPFIGKRARESSMLINTELKKVNTASRSNRA